MTTQYPGAKDNFAIHQDNNGEKVAAADVNNLQDSVTALENTVGYGSTQPTATPTADVIAKWDSNKGLSAAAFIPQGLTGATAANRYVGATNGGAPTTGTFAVGDWVIDTANAMIWVCTTAGSPGTWTSRTTPIDTWHQPTLLNAWVSLSAAPAIVGYKKDTDGFVRLMGAVKSGTTTQNTVIFNLPSGYQPPQAQNLQALSFDGTTYYPGYINITTGGAVQIGSTNMHNTWILLDGISFPTV